MNTPRGIRNNNPLNIRLSSIHWQGEILDGTDKEFCQFKDIFFGCRAAIVNLRTHIEQDKRHLIHTTIEREVSRWAPTSENQTDKYIAYVCDRMKMPGSTRIVFSNKNVVCMLLEAMARYECGTNAEICYHWFERAYEMV